MYVYVFINYNDAFKYMQDNIKELSFNNGMRVEIIELKDKTIHELYQNSAWEF